MLQRSVVGWWSLSRIGANSVKLRSCSDGMEGVAMHSTGTSFRCKLGLSNSQCSENILLFTISILVVFIWSGWTEPRCIWLKPAFGANFDCETRRCHSPSIFNITQSGAIHHVIYHYFWLYSAGRHRRSLNASDWNRAWVRTWIVKLLDDTSLSLQYIYNFSTFIICNILLIKMEPALIGVNLHCDATLLQILSKPYKKT